MLLKLFWLPQKSSVHAYVRMLAFVFLHVMEDLALHGQVRYMPSFSSSSTENNLSSLIWFSFAFLLGFLHLWSPQGNIQSSGAQQSPCHWAGWCGQPVHCAQYSSVLNCIRLRYLNPQLRTALAALLLLLFTSLFPKLHQNTWGFTPAPLAQGSAPPALPVALASTKEAANRENSDFILVLFFSFFFSPLSFLFRILSWMSGQLPRAALTPLRQHTMLPSIIHRG